MILDFWGNADTDIRTRKKFHADISADILSTECNVKIIEKDKQIK